jgi:hypothetical protein
MKGRRGAGVSHSELPSHTDAETAPGLQWCRVERAGWPNRYIVFPRSRSRNPTNVPNRCSLKPLTPKAPEEPLLLVLTQRRLTLQVVYRGLPRFQLPRLQGSAIAC